MKKILFIIMMLVTVILTSACSKKDPTPRTMDNFVNDFTMSSTAFDDYEKISKTEKGLNKLSYLNKQMSLSIATKNKTIIKKISFTVYNHSDTDYSFYICDPSEVRVSKASSDVYFITPAELVGKIEIKANEEYNVSYTLDTKFSKGKTLIISTLIAPREDKTSEDFGKIKENGGIYNFKVDYEVYL